MLGSRPVIPGADLDHVAVALERQADAWPRYLGELGGEWRGGMIDPGFIWGQIRYANGMTLEVLEPHKPEEFDFLRRFLDRNGPGPHHLTFKVKDLVAALPVVETAGYRPVNVNVDHEGWKEAFLHPKDAPGVVVQLAQSDGEWDEPGRNSPPHEQGATTASLDRVVHAVANIADGLRLFEGILGGATVDAGEDELGRWVELGWPGPGRVRLVTPTSRTAPLAQWIGDRAGRVHHLAFSGTNVEKETEVTPDDNHGVRLLLSPA